MVESHPDDQLPDLRLLSPFPELKEYCEKQDLSSMSKKDHMHTPWLVLLYHAVEEWKRTHEGQPPKTYKEKTALKQILREMNLKTAEGVPEHEDNFEEALRHVNTALQQPRLPSEIKGGPDTRGRGPLSNKQQLSLTTSKGLGNFGSEVRSAAMY